MDRGGRWRGWIEEVDRGGGVDGGWWRGWIERVNRRRWMEGGG